MTFDFGTLVAHAAKTRALGAGTIIGSGTVSNRDADGGPGKPIAEGGVGYSCLAEVRTVETIAAGKAMTPFLKAGDTVRIWAEDDKHHPIFGVIEQTVGLNAMIGARARLRQSSDVDRQSRRGDAQLSLLRPHLGHRHAGQAAVQVSNDPLLGGDPALPNPEDLLLSALSACRMLWYLHLASSAEIGRRR